MGKLSSFKTTTGKKGSVAVIDYTLLESATNNFSQSNILGEGGFGSVFKARFNDNCLAAVKKIDSGGQDSEKEFEVSFRNLNCIWFCYSDGSGILQTSFSFIWLFVNLYIQIAE